MEGPMKFVVPLVIGAAVGGAVVYFFKGGPGGDGVVPVVADGGQAQAPVVPEAPVEPAAGAAPVAAGEAEMPDAGTAAPAEGGGDPSGAGVSAEFEALMVRVFSGEATDDEQLQFWEQIRKTDEIDGVIGALRGQVEETPGDVAGRMTLAQLYTVKLLSAPAGPERGLLAAKAEEQWNAVLGIDPDHFEAQYSIAFSLSQYPDFLNKTGDAIAAYENAIAIEERTEPSAATARAYVDLARLHQKSGDPASALEVLARGAEAHPDHGLIAEQIEKLEKGFVFEEN